MMCLGSIQPSISIRLYIHQCPLIQPTKLRQHVIKKITQALWQKDLKQGFLNRVSYVLANFL